jgi:hypothetical protein
MLLSLLCSLLLLLVAEALAAGTAAAAAAAAAAVGVKGRAKSLAARPGTDDDCSSTGKPAFNAASSTDVHAHSGGQWAVQTDTKQTISQRCQLVRHRRGFIYYFNFT